MVEHRHHRNENLFSDGHLQEMRIPVKKQLKFWGMGHGNRITRNYKAGIVKSRVAYLRLSHLCDI